MTSVTRLPDPALPSGVPGVPGVRRAIRWRVVPALLPGVLMLGLGVVDVTRPVLSWDEIATADVAGRPVAQIWRLVHHIDGVFGPYYLFMHGWTGLVGDSVFDLRFPSIVAMAAAVAVTGELGRRLFGPVVGVVAGVLLCLLPNTSRYAAEARPYAFACFFATLALLLFHRALDDLQARRWCAYGAAVLGAGLSHLIALTILAAHAAILVIRLRAGSWRRTAAAWAAVVAAVLLLLSPLIWWGLHQRPAQLSWVAPVTAADIYRFPARLVGTAQPAWLLIGMVLVASSPQTRRLAETAVAMVVPLLVVALVSVVGPSFWVIRYLLFVLMPVAIAAAAGLVRACTGLRPWIATARLLAALIVVAGAAAPGQLSVRGPTAKNGSDYRTLAGIIRGLQAPGDVIVFQAGSRTMRTGVDYYLRTDAEAPRDVLLRQSAAEAAALIAREYPAPVVRLAGADRIWLVVYARRADPATARRDLIPLLRGRYQRIRLWTAERATMALYVRRR
jgi:mannosyltransferase